MTRQNVAARDVRDAARVLRRIAAEVEAGRLDVTPSQLHRLHGSIAALEVITEQEAQA